MPKPKPEMRQGHEATDVNPKWLKLVVLGLFVSAVIMQVITGSLFLALRRFEGPSRMKALTEPPQPRLEIDADKVKDRRVEDLKLLNSYSWVDRSQGIVRIPISQAMEQIAHEKK